MVIVVELSFYVGVCLLLYTYVMYPLLLFLLPSTPIKRKAAEGGGNADAQPFISVVVAAYNEEHSIADKIANFRACEYSGRRELIIVSDASSDRTDSIARQCEGPDVRLLVQSRRQGKGAALNRAVPEARGDVLVFTDATSVFARETLRELVTPFRDPLVGLVNGQLEYRRGEIANLYHRYERMLKAGEIRHGVLATAHGAVYAMRKSLWRLHDPQLVNDFLHPILVRLQGYSCTVAPGALCYEEFRMEAQFRRQVRMVALAALVYFWMLPGLIRHREWRCVLVLTSHKLLRWLTCVWLTLLGGTSAVLSSAGVIFRLALAVEGLLAAFMAIGSIASFLNAGERFTVFYRFISFNFAALVGLWMWFRGRQPSIWEPDGM